MPVLVHNANHGKNRRDFDFGEDDDPYEEKMMHGNNRHHNKAGEYAMRKGGAETREDIRRVHENMKGDVDGNGNLTKMQITEITEDLLGKKSNFVSGSEGPGELGGSGCE